MARGAAEVSRVRHREVGKESDARRYFHGNAIVPSCVLTCYGFGFFGKDGVFDPIPHVWGKIKEVPAKPA